MVIVALVIGLGLGAAVAGLFMRSRYTGELARERAATFGVAQDFDERVRAVI